VYSALGIVTPVLKKPSKTILTGLFAAFAAYVLSAILRIPGFSSGTLKGDFLHPTFGSLEFIELFLLTAALVLLAIRRRSRRLGRALVVAVSFATFNIGLILIEARLQSHGLLVEAVLAFRYGSKPALLSGAAALALCGLAVALAAARIPKPPTSRKRSRSPSRQKARQRRR
jgi:hypothetical protein